MNQMKKNIAEWIAFHVAKELDMAPEMFGAREAQKNNASLVGIICMREDSNVSPVVYVTELVGLVEQGAVLLSMADTTMSKAVRDIAGMFETALTSGIPDIKDIISKVDADYLMNNCVLQVVDTENNAGFLKDLRYQAGFRPVRGLTSQV